MKILFIHPRPESLGIEYLSAVLKKAGHETKLIIDPELFSDSHIEIKFLAKIFNFKKKIIKRAKKYGPDVVCFSVISDYYNWAKDIAREIKNELDVPIIFGGIHATSVPERVIRNSFVDFVVVGEGEFAILEIINSMKSGRKKTDIKNVWMKNNGKIISNPLRPLEKNLDSLPYPDKDIFYDEIPNIRYGYSMITSRGCPFRCSYCNNSLLKRLYDGKGEYLRRRTVDNVIDELKLAKKKYDIRTVIFHDEIFTYDVGWLREFANKYKKEINLPFFCWIHPNTVNELTVELLEKAGCATVQMGVQTMNENTRKMILQRYGSNEQLKRAVGLLIKSKIWLITDNILGLPGQENSELMELLKFYNENRVDQINIYWLRYFPKTEIVDIAKRGGFLNDGQIENLEECVSSKRFTSGGDTFNKNESKIGSLILLTQVLPKGVVDFLVRRKLYKLSPPINLYTTSIFISIFKNIIKNKRKIYVKYFSTGLYLSYYMKHMIKRFF